MNIMQSPNVGVGGKDFGGKESRLDELNWLISTFNPYTNKAELKPLLAERRKLVKEGKK